MAMTAVPATRAERMARWDAALRRAVAANLTAMRLQDGSFAISSESDEDAGYLVGGNFACTCKAATSGNRFCKHAALAMALAGVLPWPVYEPDPEPPAPAAALCPYCEGTPVKGNNICRPCLGSGLRERLTPAALAAWEEVADRRHEEELRRAA